MLSRKVIWYDFDNFRLEVETRRILKDGVQLMLSPKAFQILHILVERAGETIEKDELYNRLWADSFVEEGNLTQHIYLLRKNLGQSPSGQSYIETVARHGYRFTAEVKTVQAEISIDLPLEAPAKSEVSGPASPVEAAEPAESVKSPGHSAVPNIPINGSKISAKDEHFQRPVNELQIEQPKFKDRKLIFLTFLSLLLVGLAAGSYFYIPDLSIKRLRGAEDRKIKSIAVLPFKEIGNEGEDKHLGLGMTDAIITRLSKLKQIPVRPTSAIFPFVGAETAPVKAGRDLDVDAVLEGTVQQGGSWVRVSVRLIVVESGETVWAEKFDGEYTHIFKVQDNISAKVVESLALSLAPGEEQTVKKRTTDNLEAYQAYTLGIFFWNKRTRDGLQKAERNFLRAIALDPEYALAHAGLADTYNMLVYNRFVPLREVGERAKAAALKAVELDETAAEAHLALAQVQFSFDKNFEAGKKSLERAIELAPYSATARLRYAWLMLSEFRLDRAEEEMRLAREYDPLSANNNLALCNILILGRKYEEATRFCEQSLELDRHVPGGRNGLAEAYLFSGKDAQALALVSEEFKENTGDFYSLASVGFIYARLGHSKEALDIAGRLKIEAQKTPTLYLDLAVLNYAVGRKNEALENFTTALEKKSFSRRTFIYDPKFDELKADALFSDLVRQHGLVLN